MSIVETRCFFHALKEDRTNEEDFQKRNVGAACSPYGIHHLAGFGTTTAFAASETAESYMISFPRDGDAAQIYSEDAWGHSAKSYMNGWATGSSNYTTLHCMDSFDGKVCYCIEPGLSRNVGDTYHASVRISGITIPASTTTPSSRTILSCCWAVSCSMAIRQPFHLVEIAERFRCG